MPHLSFLNTATIHKGIQGALRRAASRAPAPVANPLIEWILNRILKQPLIDGELEFLRARRLSLDITNLNRRLNIGLVRNRLRCALSDTEGDVTFKGEVVSFVALALKTQDPDTLFFNRSLSILGDTELGLEIKNLIDRLDLTANLHPHLLHALHLLETVTQRSTEHSARSQ